MTMQIPEVLLIEGERHVLKKSPTVQAGGDVIEVDERELYTPELNAFTSTSCHRRYAAIWAIEGNKLFLKNVQGKYRLRAKCKVLASWFTGIITFDSYREGNHLFIKSYYVENGIVTEEVTDKELVYFDDEQGYEISLIDKVKNVTRRLFKSK